MFLILPFANLWTLCAAWMSELLISTPITLHTSLVISNISSFAVSGKFEISMLLILSRCSEMLSLEQTCFMSLSLLANSSFNLSFSVITDFKVVSMLLSLSSTNFRISFMSSLVFVILIVDSHTVKLGSLNSQERWRIR
uniref:NADH dehydrogenase subunit 4L n=1 Tax=Cacopsylla melanoneura TaxID=428564 RepID=A0A8D8Z3E2_9HEMI